jgi:hypothetical protein
VGHLAVAGEGRMRMKPTQNRRWKGAGFWRCCLSAGLFILWINKISFWLEPLCTAFLSLATKKSWQQTYSRLTFSSGMAPDSWLAQPLPHPSSWQLESTFYHGVQKFCIPAFLALVSEERLLGASEKVP